MMNRFEISYDEKTDTLAILKIIKNGRKIVCEEEGKYGVKIKKDIEDNPRMIVIPEASLLFGFQSVDLQKFVLNFADFS